MSDRSQTQMQELNRLYKQQDELYHNLAVRFGISDTALWILYSICSSEKPATQYDFANAWFYPKQTVNSAIARLEKTGMLSLVPVPGTRNRKNVILTKDGEAFCARTVLPLLEAEERAFRRFSEAERQTFLRLMEEQFRYLREETAGTAEQ